MSLVTNILAILGVILVVVLIVYVYKKYNAKKTPTTTTTPTFPPADYMQEVGTKCPDLWSLSTNYKSGKYQCQNTNGAPVADYNSKTKKIYDCATNAKFSVMKSWPLDDKKRQKELANRCEWIENCGPVQGTPASWIGIDDLC